MLKTTRRYITIIIGQFIAALAFRCVLLPNDLIAGGFGGIATVVNKLTGMNIQLVLIILCIPVILWAYLKYNRKLVFYAAFCFAIFTFFIGFIADVIPEFTTDKIIAAIVAGVLFGIASGMIIRVGAANGPEAIIGMYLKDKKGITIGTYFTVLNSAILGSSLIFGDITIIIYSLISIYIGGKVTDYIILGTRRDYCVNIISENFLDITEFIHNELKRGVTFVPCVGTYKVNKKMMIKAVVTNAELVILKNYVASLKDNSFVYVTESIEVFGGGFTD
ncbi:YitT family protein [Vallitalea pronyensis]|uniref:YitT family protein n=1 Tax=Vallitalea pronyensis TaxID=1348613 RepID=A0A8J8MJ92_9FIRM|nr:YitT family protein [Vallitalea pronyensis]QUI22471.1 YitT family protein [Vallitalea pronyensis]